MKLRENKWNTCGKCGHRKELVQVGSYGCDGCKKPMKSENTRLSGYPDYLEITVFHGGPREADRYQFCSWVCCFTKLKRIKNDYFISLPNLTAETTIKGQSAKDFFRCLKV